VGRSHLAIDLAWSDNSINETQFKIERSTYGRTFYPLGAAKADAESYSNIGVTSGRKYWYRIYAINASGASTMSNVVETTVPFPPVAGAAAAPAIAPAPAVFSIRRVSEKESLLA
jgi:hypothetical protein